MPDDGTRLIFGVAFYDGLAGLGLEDLGVQGLGQRDLMFDPMQMHQAHMRGERSSQLRAYTW